MSDSPALTPGPELDAQVARALGCKVVDTRCECYVRHAELRAGGTALPYSTDVAYAISALEAWCEARRGYADLTVGPGGWWTVTTGDGEFTAPLPTAICRAILAATEEDK